MSAKLLTRYLLGSGTIRMNVLLDRVVPLGSYLKLRDDEEMGPDAGLEWKVLERYETLEAREIEDGTVFRIAT